MVRHYALLYGFHTLPNMLIKPLSEAHGFVYVCKCLTYETAGQVNFHVLTKKFYQYIRERMEAIQ